MTMGDTDLNEPSFKLSEKSCISFLLLCGGFSGHASPSDNISEPIEIQLRSSRCSPSTMDPNKGEAVAPALNISSRYLLRGEPPGYSIAAGCNANPYSSKSLYPRQTHQRLTRAGLVLHPLDHGEA
ncbi:hypothetical protein AVEN_77685-1 [Araneus ventricosus]|uniref:Uncharacterized protein n=1 Tax=Araneus ventricosus TaxID=182803 RepID=A0A4Y2T1D0_ARAVE|nr:hypothetical protein AVEN_77685-1 [Araneus ventricosus]